MEFALFLGCNIPTRVKQYEMSVRAVSEKLGLKLTDIKDFNCCGNPVRYTDFKTYLIFAARNLALAEKKGMHMCVLCKCCYGSLKNAEYALKNDESLFGEINTLLHKEGLEYKGDKEIKHFLSILFHDVGVDTIKEKNMISFKDFSIAAHYGCHALRPGKITQFDDPLKPVLFDELIKATGAKSVEWSMKSECCGAPVFGINDELSMDLTKKKLKNGKDAGADYVCVACPYCHMQFDNVQNMMIQNNSHKNILPSVLYPQLLGLSMGISQRKLGIKMNAINIDGLAKSCI